MLLFLASYDADGLDQTLEMEYTGILTKPFFISAFKKKIAGVKEAFVQEKAEEANRMLSYINGKIPALLDFGLKLFG